METQQAVTQGMQDGFNSAGEAIRQGHAIQQIQTTYATAVTVQKPRELAVVQRRCLQEAALAGETCFYGWGVGQNRVEGPSIDCAMIAVRNWGNSVVEMRPVVETPSAYVMEAAFVDLETGFTYSRQFRQSKKWRVFGKMDDERKEDVRFQIGQSKAQRNAILKSLPKWLIDKMIDEAKKGVRLKLEAYIEKSGIESARKLMLDSLIKQGVKLEQIEYKYSRKYGAWDVELLVTLKGDLRALQDGAESAAALFPPETEEPTGGPGLSPSDMKPGDPKAHQGHELQPNEQVDTETGEVTEKEAEPEPEAKSKPNEVRRQELMKMQGGPLQALATTLFAKANIDGVVEDSTEYLQRMVECKTLADVDFASKKNNKGHIALFVLALEELTRVSTSAAGGQAELGAGF